MRGGVPPETESALTTAANLVNELVEAGQHHGVRRVLARWMRYDVIALDEVGYVPLAEIGAEFLFQVIAERAERATLIVTTNLPFSEWTQVFPNPRLCKALLDRITDRAHITRPGRNRIASVAPWRDGRRRKLRKKDVGLLHKWGGGKVSDADPSPRNSIPASNRERRMRKFTTQGWAK